MPAAWSYSSAFVKVPRAIGDQLARDPLLLAVFYVLLSRARYQAGQVIASQGAVIDLEVGQAVYGRGELAMATGASEARLRTALKRLRTLDIITSQTTSRGTVVTLCGFSETYAATRAESPAESPAGGGSIEITSRTTEKSPADHQPVASGITSRIASRETDPTQRQATGTSNATSLGSPAESPADHQPVLFEITSRTAPKSPLTRSQIEKEKREERNTHSLQITTARDRSTSQQSTSARSKSPLHPEPLGIAETLRALVESTNPGAIKKDTRTVRDWAIDIENLHRTGPSYDDIAQLVAWLGTTHPKADYRPHVLSGRDLRTKWDRLLAAQQRERPNSTGRIDPKTANHDEEPTWMKRGHAS